MKALFCTALLALGLLAGCSTTNQTPPAARAEASPPNRAVYVLQHRTLPAFVFRSDGAFFADLIAGQHDILRQVVVDTLGADYFNGMKFTPHSSGGAVFISFPEPQGMPECHHVAVVRATDGKFRYFTLEKTLDLPGTGIKTALCEWTADGAHVNGGFRTYTDFARFRTEVERLLRNPQAELDAAAITR